MIDDVEVRDADPKGCGVYARRRFAEGEFIFRRRHSKVVSVDELDDVSERERMHFPELDFNRFAVLASRTKSGHRGRLARRPATREDRALLRSGDRSRPTSSVPMTLRVGEYYEQRSLHWRSTSHATPTI